MNRWIEFEGNLYNLDAYDCIYLDRAEITFAKHGEVSDRRYFDSFEKAQKLYEKIKSKLNLKEWE